MVPLGKILILFGLITAAIGLILWLFGDKLTFFGSLPGDIKVEKENFKFYFPITTMIILSIVLSLGFWLFQKLFR